MYFKPRIFISSTLNISIIRNRIKKIFEKSGAEILLYENNLTPSTKSYTYRNDISQSDFVIFIFDEKSGQITNTGLTGTQEEWDLTKLYNIPSHLYIKKGLKNQKQKRNLKEISKGGVSFYYYTNPRDLLQQIHQTIFTIAREAFVYRLNYNTLPERKVKEMAFDFDCKTGLNLIRGFQELINLHHGEHIDLFKTNLFAKYFESWIQLSRVWKSYYIDSEIDKSFKELMNSISSFIEYQSINTSIVGVDIKLKFKSINLIIEYIQLKAVPSYKNDAILALWTELLKYFEKFKKFILERSELSQLHI